MGQCTACAAGAYLDKGYCKPCDAKCERCTAAGSCTACKGPYCKGTDGTCKESKEAHTGCSQCAPDTNVCIACDNGYFYKEISSNPCVQCSANCRVCKNETECIEANVGYYVDSTTKQPVACSVTTCAYCPSNSCVECKLNYTLSNNQCTQCADNCLRCKDNKCTFCKAGYAVDSNGTCQACAAGCGVCANTEVSLLGKCLFGGCKEGYVYLATSQMCYSCPTNCADCYYHPGSKYPYAPGARTGMQLT